MKFRVKPYKYSMGEEDDDCSIKASVARETIPLPALYDDRL